MVVIEASFGGQYQGILAIGKLHRWLILQRYKPTLAPGELLGVEDRGSRVFLGRAGPP
jgi:hypothetical protein